MKFFCFVLTLFLSLSYHLAKGGNGDDETGSKFHLPENLKPEKYYLKISTDINENVPTFSGSVLITFKCETPTNEIVLNAKYLEITKGAVSVTPDDDSLTKLPIVDQNPGTQNDEYIITLEQSLMAGVKYRVYLEFNGLLSQEYFGFFAKAYKDVATNRKRRYAATKMGVNGARRVFPCFDQLNLKSTYKIFLEHPDTVKGISNAKRHDTKLIEAGERNGKWVEDEFDESDPLSTSFLAIALVNFYWEELIEPQSRVKIRVWANDLTDEQMKLTAKCAADTLNFYSTTFTVPYPLSKLDIVALPSSHATNDENYGLIFIRTSSLRFNNDLKNTYESFNQLMDVCHVIGQQWFGAMVTMSQWNEYLLHQALILYFEMLCFDQSVPNRKSQLGIWHIAVVFISSLLNDVKYSSKPVYLPLEKMDFNRNILDNKSLSKATSLIYMMNFFLGSDVFHKSIAEYLNKFKFKVSTLDQVWNIFTHIAHNEKVLAERYTVKEIMDSWIMKRGFPFLTVTRKEDGKGVIIKQERFVFLDEESEENSKNACWMVPITYTTSRFLEFEHVVVRDWLTCDKPLTLDIQLQSDEWIIVNLKQHVFARTNYDPENWELLRKTLLDENRYSEIEELTRAHLISDILELPKAGLQFYDMAFATVLYLKHEHANLPWIVALHELNKICLRLFRTDAYEPFRKYIRERILNSVFAKPEYNNINDMQENPNDLMKFQLKKTIIQASSLYAVDSCRQQCWHLFNQWYLEGEESSIDPNVRDIVYSETMKVADEDQWNFLRNQYARDGGTKENEEILKALAQSSNPQILKKYLEWSLKENEILPADSIIVFESLSTNELGYPLMKDFFIEKVDVIAKFHAENFAAVGIYLVKLLEATTKETDLNDLKDFIAANEESIYLLKSELQSAIEKATRSVFWLRRHEDKLTELLANLNSNVFATEMAETSMSS